MKNKIDFQALKNAAQSHIPDLVMRWLPDAKRSGNELIALNPRKDDKSAGSFSINMKTGLWGDFAEDTVGDIISLCAYLYGESNLEAAKRIASIIGFGTAQAHSGRAPKPVEAAQAMPTLVTVPPENMPPFPAFINAVHLVADRFLNLP